MKVRILLLLVSSLFTNCAIGQNLVPNPGFEDTTGCPLTLDNLDLCKDWSNFGGTCDYFNSCSESLGFYNPWGFQAANTGNAYVGLATWSYNPLDYREYLGSKLSIPMQIGEKYYVSMSVCRAKGEPSFTVASNRLGVLFRTKPMNYSVAGGTIFNSASIYSDLIVSDTVNWTTISGLFIADSNYQYIAIGNFFDNLHTDTLNFGPYNIAAIYFIDDVCVSTDSLSCKIIDAAPLLNSHEDLHIYPNPASNYIFIETQLDLKSIRLYDSVGREISSSHIQKGAGYLLHFDQVESGIFLLELNTITNKIVKKILIFH